METEKHIGQEGTRLQREAEEQFRNSAENQVISSLRSNSLVTIGEVARYPEAHNDKDGITVTKTEVSIILQDGGNEGLLLRDLERVNRLEDGRYTTFERDGDKFNRVDVLLIPGAEAKL